MPTRGHQRSARPRKRGIIARLFRWIALLALAFVALSVGAVTALRWLAPPTSAFMVLDALGVIGSAEPVRYRWVPWAKISPHCPLAVMAAEDQRFPEHRGFDVDAIADAIESYREGGRLRGASTISQQVAKNLFLWPGRSLARKGVEAWFTALIELVWPKQRILEVYLNVAEFGPGTYGVGEASERFFHRPASDLSAGQCALLAAVLPNPRRFSVVAPTGYVVERQGWIRRQMRQLGGVGFLERI